MLSKKVGLADLVAAALSVSRQVKERHEVHVSRRSVPAPNAPSRIGGEHRFSAQFSSDNSAMAKAMELAGRRELLPHIASEDLFVRCSNVGVGEVIDQITLTNG